ncbi:MAG: hypothetical protein L0I88_03570 [Alkalibacterium sp.]|nr:hypothetical protein [Alkalibacterium sp.]
MSRGKLGGQNGTTKGPKSLTAKETAMPVQIQSTKGLPDSTSQEIGMVNCLNEVIHCRHAHEKQSLRIG